ncbi:MAG TPA: SufE family protein [Thermoanaerobaculia bacterium]|nr:SufE family protein [Thermoanaerobaculia bacterium]
MSPATRLPAKLARLVDALALMPDRQERIETLIRIADRFRPVPPELAQRPYPEENKAPACESEAYAWALPQPDGTLRFYFAVENPQGVSAKAMAVILDETLSGAPVEEVARVPLSLANEIFGSELSMGKSMGLSGMVALVAAAARRQAAENQFSGEDSGSG